MKAIEKANRATRLAAKAPSKSTMKKAPAPDKLAQAERVRRLAICESCPYSKQTSEEKKNGVKICHKCNRHTFAIASNTQTKCPKGKF